MTPELTPEIKETVKATVPVLKQHGRAIITRFYAILFERYPQVQRYFNMDRQSKGKSKTDGTPAQIEALSRAVLAYASNIDNLGVLLPTVKSIAHKHVSRGVQPPQYDAVGECLIAAIGDVLGAAATPSIVHAWTQAYGFLANLFIQVEKDIRAEAASISGYDGFVPMTVKGVESANSAGSTLYLVPKSGLIPKAKKGQYAAIVVPDIPNVGESMLTANVSEESSSELRLVVPQNGDMANNHLMKTVKSGSIITVGMICGEA